MTPGASTRRSIDCCPYPPGAEIVFPFGNGGGNQPHGNPLDHPDRHARPRAARVLFAQRLVDARLGPQHAIHGPSRSSGAAQRALQRCGGRDAPATRRGRRRARVAPPRRHGSAERRRDRQRALLGVCRHRRLAARGPDAEPARAPAPAAVCPGAHAPRGVARTGLPAPGRSPPTRAAVDHRRGAGADRASRSSGHWSTISGIVLSLALLFTILRGRALHLHGAEHRAIAAAEEHRLGHVGRSGAADALLAALRHELRGARAAGHLPRRSAAAVRARLLVAGRRARALARADDGAVADRAALVAGPLADASCFRGSRCSG